MQIANRIFGILLGLAIITLLWQLYAFKPQIMVTSYLKKGNKQYQMASFGDAEVFYRQTLPFQEAAAEPVYLNLGNSLYKQGRLKEAKQAYQQQLQYPVSGKKVRAHSWFNLGNALFQTGDTLESLEAFKHAYLLEKQDTKIRQNFLYVLKIINEKAQRKKAAKNAPLKKETKKEKESRGKEESEGKEATEEDQKQAELSEKNMEELLKQIQKNEDDVRGRINNSKQILQRVPPGELDY